MGRFIQIIIISLLIFGPANGWPGAGQMGEITQIQDAGALTRIKISKAHLNSGGGYTFYGPDSDGDFKNLYVFDVEFTLKDDIFGRKQCRHPLHYHQKDIDILHLDWNIDVGVFIEDEVYPKVFTTLMVMIPITDWVVFTIGGGFGYIYNSGEIDGFDQGILAGTARAGLILSEWIFIGVDHYSLVFRHDPGRNPLRFGIIINF